MGRHCIMYMLYCTVLNSICTIAARDEGRGKEAVQALSSEGLNPKFHQLDIDDSASIDRLRDFLKEQYGGLDILVNNAGIAFKVRLWWRVGCFTMQSCH